VRADPRTGVLALQGSSQPHLDCLRKLGHEPVAVRAREQLEGLTHLILPGGESTTIHHLLQLFDLEQAIRERWAEGRLALFGTCAGAILLGCGVETPGQPKIRDVHLGLLDATLERNAYGRQIDSFTSSVQLEQESDLHAVFIRAPRFVDVGPGARVLARHRGEPVLVEGKGLLAATFHPELSGDLRVHRRCLALQAGL